MFLSLCIVTDAPVYGGWDGVNICPWKCCVRKKVLFFVFAELTVTMLLRIRSTHGSLYPNQRFVWKCFFFLIVMLNEGIMHLFFYFKLSLKVKFVPLVGAIISSLAITLFLQQEQLYLISLFFFSRNLKYCFSDRAVIWP